MQQFLTMPAHILQLQAQKTLVSYPPMSLLPFHLYKSTDTIAVIYIKIYPE